MIEIGLEGDIDRKVLLQAVELFRHEESEPIAINVGRSINTEDFFTVTELTAMAQCLALLIKAVLYLHRRADEAKQWNRSRLVDVIDKQMLGIGVTDYIVDHIDNFDCLTGKGPCPCIVRILSSTGARGFQVCIFRNADAFTIEVQRRLGLL